MLARFTCLCPHFQITRLVFCLCNFIVFVFALICAERRVCLRPLCFWSFYVCFFLFLVLFVFFGQLERPARSVRRGGCAPRRGVRRATNTNTSAIERISPTSTTRMPRPSGVGGSVRRFSRLGGWASDAARGVKTAAYEVSSGQCRSRAGVDLVHDFRRTRRRSKRQSCRRSRDRSRRCRGAGRHPLDPPRGGHRWFEVPSAGPSDPRRSWRDGGVLVSPSATVGMSPRVGAGAEVQLRARARLAPRGCRP